jgi:CheY-like chemotaxis protein
MASAKKEKSTTSTHTQIEKHLHNIEKYHKDLWQITQNFISEISQIIKFFQKVDDQPGPKTKKIDQIGDDHHLTEILNQHLENLAMIRKILRSPDLFPEENVSLPENRESTNSTKVLIVDDDPISRKLVSHFLQNAQYSVTSAPDGKEGLRAALDEPPDIILIDIMMPGLDGFQLLSQLKANSETTRIPAIILSSLNSDNEILKGLKGGAVDFITKPFSPQVLQAKIEKILETEKCICP